jgi:hypothetical protein
LENVADYAIGLFHLDLILLVVLGRVIDPHARVPSFKDVT